MSTHDPNHGRDRNPAPHPDDPSVREGFEVTDANTGGIAVFLVSLFISVGVFFAVCFVFGMAINRGLDKEDGPVNKWAAQNQIAPRREIQSSPVLQQQQLAKLTQEFPTPRLETDDGNQDLADLHGREDLLLEHYSWIDRGKGTVRIPIERAMELIAQRGLPVAPAVETQKPMFGDKVPVVTAPLTDGFAPTALDQQAAAQRAAELAKPGEEQ
jgi:hypothetical protein